MADPKKPLKDLTVGEAEEVVRALWRLRNVLDPFDGDDPLTNDLLKAAKEDGLVFMTGYLGASEAPRDGGGPGKPEWRRLYSSLDLSDYADIESVGIVKAIDLRTPLNPLAGQGLWVKLGTEIVVGQTAVARMHVEAGFLGGDIASMPGGYSTGAEIAGGRSPAPFCHGGRSPAPFCHGGRSPAPFCSG